MFTQIYKFAAATGLILLAGCQLGDVKNFAGQGANPAVTSAIETTAVLRGGTTIAGPDGYCIDVGSGQKTLLRQSMVLASCARLRTPDEPDPTFGRLLTVASIGKARTDLESLAAYVRSEAGQQALSAENDAATVEVLDVKTSAHAVYVEHSDNARVSHLGATAWRAFLNVGDRMLLLSVYSGVGSPVAGSSGETVLRDFAAEILRQNAANT